MSGTKAGGLKAAATNKKNHGKDFYKRIGAKGGANGHTGGFYADRKLAIAAGAKGGRISRRGPMLRDALGNPIKKDGTRVNYPKRKAPAKEEGVLSKLIGKLRSK